MPKRSAGLLLFRRRGGNVEVFLVHPGGPFWSKKDLGAWSIPKGEYAEGEDPLEAALREFQEETGTRAGGVPIPLRDIRQAGGKIVSAWAMEGDFEAARLRSNLFRMEWPPKSGETKQFPEIDKGEWFSIDAARLKLLKSQTGFLDQLVLTLAGGSEN
ncbi:MAG TPA: NUDIX domain-containing protein [Bryobacteraceae bacterium]|nr:NUDIX domain-containing protein [Bryobacteraceae bacterium]